MLVVIAIAVYAVVSRLKGGASTLAWLGLLSLGGILLAGPPADAIGNKIPIAVTFALRIVPFAVLFSFKGRPRSGSSRWALA